MWLKTARMSVLMWCTTRDEFHKNKSHARLLRFLEVIDGVTVGDKRSAWTYSSRPRHGQCCGCRTVILRHSSECPQTTYTYCGHFVSIRSQVFLFAVFLALEFNDQWKRIWCDMQNVPLDAFLDKYDEPFCYFLSLYLVCACRSIPSNWHNARLLLMKPRAQQMNEKHTAVAVEMYVLCWGPGEGGGKQDNRQMTGAILRLSWFVQGVSGQEKLIRILLLWTTAPSVKFACVILFPCCIYLCISVY
jgi:hypothetical protein